MVSLFVLFMEDDCSLWLRWKGSRIQHRHVCELAVQRIYLAFSVKFVGASWTHNWRIWKTCRTCPAFVHTQCHVLDVCLTLPGLSCMLFRRGWQCIRKHVPDMYWNIVGLFSKHLNHVANIFLKILWKCQDNITLRGLCRAGQGPLKKFLSTQDSGCKKAPTLSLWPAPWFRSHTLCSSCSSWQSTSVHCVNAF
jgi:hypothetical protein